MLFSPVHMVMVPPRHYCVVLNPVARDQDGEVLFDQSGQAKLRHADLEIRLAQEPFPLYPGEEIQQVRLQLPRVCPGLRWRPAASASFCSGRDSAPGGLSGHGAAHAGAARLPGGRWREESRW